MKAFLMSQVSALPATHSEMAEHGLQNSSSGSSRTFRIPGFLLNDLCCRFLLNLPQEYRKDIIRIFFQVELAHWYYLDFIVTEKDSNARPVGIKDFADQIFKHAPTLLKETDVGDQINIADLHQLWRQYKLSVPTFGVVLLDPTLEYCLLVQGYSKSWGFPKGKVNEDEDWLKCAAREVLEETGYDVEDRLKPDMYVEHQMADQKCRLYILPDVPLETRFLPQSRQEIKAMKWFPIIYLPTHKKDFLHSEALCCQPNNFFMVIPFVNKIKKWIKVIRNDKPEGRSPKPDTKNVSKAEQEFYQTTRSDYQELLEIASGARKKEVKKLPPAKLVSTKPDTKPQSAQAKRSPKPGSMNQQNKPLHPTPPSQPLIQPVPAWKDFKLDTQALLR